MSEAFAPFEAKMRGAGLPDAAIRAFEHAYEALRRGESGLLPGATLAPVGPLPEADSLAGSREDGVRALPGTVVIKLNGGLGTSMGMTRAKSLLEVKPGLSFLDVTARQIRALAERHGVQVPLVLMNSFRTRADSLAELARHGPLSGKLPPDFLQHRVPRISVDGLAPVAWPRDPDLEWCPPGHGDLYPALETSGALAAMLDAGYRTAFVSNSDNLGATLDLALLGHFVRSGAPFAMEVKERAETDRKGGHLARRAGGGLLLRELAQCPEAEREDFEDVTRWREFNTNNLWIDLPALAGALSEHGGFLPLPMIRNEKRVDPLDDGSPRCIQLETAMGAAISLFRGALAVRVPSTRFAPVKTTNDLLRVRSDAYELDAEQRIVPAPGSAALALRIDLDPDWYQRVDQFEERFASGAPSLREARSLRVRGDVRFGRGVRVRGDVALRYDGPHRVPDGALLEG